MHIWLQSSCLLLKNCFFVCHSLRLMNPSPPGYQIYMIWWPLSQIAAVIIWVLNMWTGSLQGDPGILFLLLEQARGRRNEKCPQFHLNSGKDVLSIQMDAHQKPESQAPVCEIHKHISGQLREGWLCCSVFMEPGGWRWGGQLRTACLFYPCGTHECKPYWLSELDVLCACPSGESLNSSGAGCVVQILHSSGNS